MDTKKVPVTPADAPAMAALLRESEKLSMKIIRMVASESKKTGRDPAIAAPLMILSQIAALDSMMGALSRLGNVYPRLSELLALLDSAAVEIVRAEMGRTTPKPPAPEVH